MYLLNGEFNIFIFIVITDKKKGLKEFCYLFYVFCITFLVLNFLHYCLPLSLADFFIMTRFDSLSIVCVCVCVLVCITERMCIEQIILVLATQDRVSLESMNCDVKIN